jgi:hypothetical protein
MQGRSVVTTEGAGPCYVLHYAYQTWCAAGNCDVQLILQCSICMCRHAYPGVATKLRHS